MEIWETAESSIYTTHWLHWICMGAIQVMSLDAKKIHFLSCLFQSMGSGYQIALDLDCFYVQTWTTFHVGGSHITPIWWKHFG